MKVIKDLFVCIWVPIVLIACGGGAGSSTESNSTPGNTPAANTAPIANSGELQSTLVGTTIFLDGSASFDAESNPLTYTWTLTYKPNQSTAILSSRTSPKPTFTADVAGNYMATLVVNDGIANSQESTVTITASTANAVPVANAGIVQNVIAGSIVTLDGSTSSDANLDSLTYAWELTSKPTGSASILSSTTSLNPTFTADVAGNYMATLVVNDGIASSQVSTVTITAFTANAVPIANAGIVQNVIVGSVVTLDGSASSDANLDSLTYSWTLTSKPATSGAIINNASLPKPTFTADIAGDYVATLVVNDGKENSTASTVAIKAAPLPEFILFNDLHTSLKTIFTKSTFETTETFVQRAQTELFSQKTYLTMSTPNTYNIASTIYDADNQKAKITFYISCRSGDAGEPCSPETGILMHEIRGASTSNSSSVTQYLLTASNAPPDFSTGIEVHVLPADAPDLVNGNYLIKAEFTLDSTVPVSTEMNNLLMPTTSYHIRTRSGYNYYYTYPSINAIVSKLIFVSRATGESIATYTF